MLRFIISIIGILGLILRRILDRRPTPKSAEQQLQEGSYTDAAVKDAANAADAKFGKKES